jgi:hypothetical protein
LLVEPILISLFLFMFQIKICQQILNVSHGFQHTYGESKWDHHPQFWHNFLIRFWQGFFLYIYIPYTISCLPVSNVSKISVYKICLEIYLCILNSEFYVMYRISLHSMWQITTKHLIHWHFVIQIQIQIDMKSNKGLSSATIQSTDIHKTWNN